MHLHGIRLRRDEYPSDDEYPFSLPVLQATEMIPLRRPITILVGDNGSGKSTLLEALARRCRIHIWGETQVLRMARSRFEKYLHRYLDVDWADGPAPGSYFSSEMFRRFSELFEEFGAIDPGQMSYFGGRSLLTQSHGESFLAYFANRYRVEGLHLLDEPETALAPPRQADLVRILCRSATEGRSQFVMATHSPILLACPGAEILHFHADGVRPIEYGQVEHVRFYREFFADPQGFFGSPAAD